MTPEPKEWHDDTTNTALDDGYDGEALDANENGELVGEEIEIDDWGGAM